MESPRGGCDPERVAATLNDISARLTQHPLDRAPLATVLLAAALTLIGGRRVTLVLLIKRQQLGLHLLWPQEPAAAGIRTPQERGSTW